MVPLTDKLFIDTLFIDTSPIKNELLVTDKLRIDTLFMDVSPIINELLVTDKLRIDTLFMDVSPINLDDPLTSKLFNETSERLVNPRIDKLFVETLKNDTKLVLLPIIILFDESIIKLLIYNILNRFNNLD